MKPLLIPLVLLFPLICLGQISVKNTSLTQTDTNILYRTIDNRLLITGKPQNAVVAITGCCLTKLSDSVYSVQVEKAGEKRIVIRQYGTVLFRKKFKVLPISFFPVAQVGYQKDTLLTISEILRNPFLNIAVPNTLYHYSGNILRFKLEIIDRLDHIIMQELITEGNALTTLQKEIIHSLSTGDKLVFKSIIVSESSARLTALQLNIYIK